MIESSVSQFAGPITREMRRGAPLKGLTVVLDSALLRERPLRIELRGSALEQAAVVIQEARVRPFGQQVLPWEKHLYQQCFERSVDSFGRVLLTATLAPSQRAQRDRVMLLALVGRCVIAAPLLSLEVTIGALCDDQSARAPSQRATFLLCGRVGAEGAHAERADEPSTGGSVRRVPRLDASLVFAEHDRWRAARRALLQCVRDVGASGREATAVWDAIGQQLGTRSTGKSQQKPSGRWSHSPSTRRIWAAIGRAKWGVVHGHICRSDGTSAQIWLEERRSAEGEPLVYVRVSVSD
jgi:hypothetical protein